ncbi:reverse transcriptase domain-containing protein [Tanacetum coccineum]
MNFMVIRSSSQHNAIIGRPGIRKIRAVPSTAHGMLKFPVEGGTVTLQSSRVIPMECAMISGPSTQPPAASLVPEEKINIAIHPEYPEQTIAIGSTLTEKGRKELCSLLKQNLDIFAWKPADMTGVPRNIAEHCLNIREGYSPVRQKKRGQAPERNKAIQEEVAKLVDAGIMKEVHYHSWLSNPVMVKKHDGTWRMCVDFKDLNNACPKDCYPLPEIDWKVESLCGQANDEKDYFQATRSLYITSQPIKQLLSSSEISGRMLKWKFELEGYDIQYRPRTAIKGQILADFIVERPEEESPDELMAEPEALPEPWTLFTTAHLRRRIRGRVVRRKAVRYAHDQWKLYKKSFLGTNGFVAKVIQTGYTGTTMHMDARNLIKECNDCQIHRPVPRNPQQNLTPITSPWPFYKWGIDIAGPFPEGPGKVKFLIVAIDYFTKWIEAKAVATITGNQVKKFVWDNIVCRFGLPGEIISDNGKQFRDNPFKDWCEKLCIRQCFASVKHPQANGLVERANRSLGEGIKARLDERSKDWIEELPHVLWAHRTMIKSSNGETPFSLTYGTEAVIPAEIGMPTLRTAEIDQAKNNEALGINLDLIEERREQAAIQEAKSKKKMEKYYNSRVRGTSFKPGDMVYRSNEASHAKDGGKLGPKWEGPYEVKESLGKGAYKLKDRKGNDMPRTWNICNLKKCYIHEM